MRPLYSNCIDLTGRRFGQWLVLAPAECHRYPSGVRHRLWLCRCDCGERAKVAGHQLRHGRTRRCPRCAQEASAKWARARSTPVGDGRTVAQIAQATGLKLDTVYHRLIRGWEPWQLGMRPLRRGGRRA